MKLIIKSSNILFINAYLIYMFAMFLTYLSLDNTQILKNLFSLVAVVLLVINYLRQNSFIFSFSVRYVLLFFLISVVIILAILYGDYYILVLFLFGLNLKNIDPDIFFPLSFLLLSICSLFVVFFSLVGVLDNIITQRGEGDMSLRYSFGFYHSNVLPLIFLYCCIYFFIIKKKITILNFIVIQILGNIIFYFCGSRNAFYSLQIFLSLLIIYQVMCKVFKNNIGKLKKIIRVISYLIFAIISSLSLILVEQYNAFNIIAVSLNEYLNNRILMASLYFHYQPIKIIKIMTYKDFRFTLLTLDNGYYYSIARYGIVYLIFIIFLSIKLSKKFSKKENYFALIGLIVLAVINFIDNGFFSFMFYPFMIYGVYAIFFKDNIAKYKVIS